MRDKAGPEDFLAGGDTNLLRAMTLVSQELFGANTHAVTDVRPEYVRMAAIMAERKQLQREFADVEWISQCWHEAGQPC